MKSSGLTKYLKRAAAFSALWVLGFGFAHPAFAQPAWFKHKKKVEEEKKEEQEAKDKEVPAIGQGAAPDSTTNPFSLSKPNEPPTETNLLFKRKGVTDFISFDIGKLNQGEIEGTATSVQYGIGWWWTPSSILSFTSRATGIFQSTYYYMLLSVGPQYRYFLTKNWAVSAYAGYGFSQGLSRVEIDHIPPPPTSTALRARRGLIYSAQLSYVFWARRDIGLSPTITYWGGSQGERSLSAVTFGFTYQGGKPNYTGDVTDR